MSSQVSSVPRRELNVRQRETVERLLAAGAEELRATGFEGLTVRAVAARAGVSPATAYTYLSSKHHLLAELFLRHLTTEARPAPAGATALARVQSLTRQMADSLSVEPALAAGATQALLGTDPDVARLRLRIGGVYVEWFREALGDDGDPEVDDAMVEALWLAFAGALLQVGMGLMTFTEMADRLDSVVATILRGNR